MAGRGAAAPADGPHSSARVVVAVLKAISLRGLAVVQVATTQYFNDNFGPQARVTKKGVQCTEGHRGGCDLAMLSTPWMSSLTALV
jgi:hypothetical protein